MTPAAALTELLTRVDLSVEPELSTAEAVAALAGTMRYKDRGATAVYGDFIAVGGRLYRCVWDGNTNATLPAVLGHTCLGRWVLDGTVQWEDMGPRPSSKYDFVGAMRRLYSLRVQRSAELVNIGDKDSKLDIESLHDHWVKERAKLVIVRAV